MFCNLLVPETTVRNLRSTAVNSSSISLDWDINRALRIYGPLRQFVIKYYPTVNGAINSNEVRTFEKVTLNDITGFLSGVGGAFVPP